jgi:hypothetical protein
MDVIQFTTVIGPDGLIHPPDGVELPAGSVKVVVRPEQASDAQTAELTFGWLVDLAREVEALNPNLPSDLAEQHDHYAHGKPKS